MCSKQNDNFQIDRPRYILGTYHFGNEIIFGNVSPITLCLNLSRKGFFKNKLELMG